MGLAQRASAGLAAVLKESSLLWVGFGLFLSTYCGGPLCTTYLVGLLGEWQRVILAQFVLFAGTGIGALALWALAARRRAHPSTATASVAYAAIVVVCLVVQGAFGLLGSANDIAVLVLACVLSFVVGLVTALPLLFWFERLLAACRRDGRARCTALIGFAELVSIAVTLALVVFDLIGIPVAPFATGTAVVATAACQIMIARREPTDDRAAAPESSESYTESTSDTGRYFLTVYSRAMLVCFGVTWGLAVCVSQYTSATGTPSISLWILGLATIAAVAAIAWLVNDRGGGSLRFGTLIRISVAAAGMVLALTPILRVSAPALFYPLTEVVFFLEEVGVILFSVELCYENGLRVAEVLPVNHAVFVLGACAAAFLFWLFQVVAGGQTAWELVAALGTFAVVSIIPFLPSRASGAAVFALEKLPEEEGYEARVAMRRDALVAKYGLVEREAEVLNLLLQGKTRQQIADKLILSPWTIKDRTAKLYEKLGVHSFKELMQLVEGDGE